VLQGGSIYWAHCGDSRLYLLRGDRLIARTRDHSYSELREALSHVVPIEEKVNRNVLFTCLGSPGKPVIDIAGPIVMRTGDRVLLCSDGLWSSVEDADIVSLMAGYPIHDSVPELVEQALRNAGEKSDNVTALAVEWEATEDDESKTGVSTRTLGEDVFASTIQASMSGDSFLPGDFDEDEIERSIREINEAIQRSGPRKP
jgi:serine/threonine protein phosphatase PrpC